jgi:hypothetical protein
MCTGLEILAIASIVASVGGTAYSAVQQDKAASKQADLQDEQAAQEKVAAEAEAAKIRDKGQRVAASQSAALAASGVKLDGQGSGGALLGETARLTESDALAAITGGNNRAKLLEGEASISRDKGNAALISGGLNAASTIIGGASAFQKSKENSKTATNLIQSTGKKLTLLGD